METRALWKGFLTIEQLSCAVALYSAVSVSERISFHVVNRKTGNRVRREYADEQTGKVVERGDQVKGYETTKGQYLVLEPDEIAAVVPESDKTLKVEAFIPCNEVDTVYFDKPYFLAPADEVAEEAFAVIREGLRDRNVVALARSVLFRRVRTLLIRPQAQGLTANTLHFDYEVRAADAAFADIPAMHIKGEMLDLARHIIETKAGKFDPAGFDDRYDAALAELVKAKMEGRKIEPPKRAREGGVIDLMDALRKSAAATRQGAAKSAAPRRKAS
ncbi:MULTISPECIES: non-homologous end joining protein Ku [Phyllobacteriaceae]|uniref:non-homologous end joining protein Ku n=1 Tax=Mesorhizobium sp. PUT5 TaxID=3454629 RepID=UPI003FA4CBEB